MIKKTICLFSALTLFFASTLCSDEQDGRGKEFRDLGVRELTLDNGMKVVLKHTEYADDEVSVKMTASGGFALLHEDDRASAELAATIAWESGLGGYCCDKLTVLMYENTVDLSVRVLPFSRVIEASAMNEGVDTLFEVVNLLFTHSHFEKKAFYHVLKKAKGSILKRPSDHELAFEDIYRGLNTENYHALKPLSIQDLEKIDFIKSRIDTDKAGIVSLV